MPKNFRILALCFVLACAAIAMADNGTVEVRVYNTQGQLVTNATLTTLSESGGMVKYTPRPDGVFEINAVVGEKVEFTVSTDTLTRNVIRYNEIVPASEQITLINAATDAPSNDLCDDGIPVGVPSLTAGTTVGATTDTEFGTCGTGITSPGVWYVVTGTGKELTATTCPDVFPGAGATYDTKISVYCGDCDDATCVGGNDDVSCSQIFRSAVTWCSQLNATYLVLVHGFGGATGDFDLGVFESGPICDPEVQCLPLGACCSCLDPPFNCTVVDQGTCLAIGGVPRGAGTNCFPELGEPVEYVAFPGLPLSSTLPPAVDTISVAESFTVGDVNVDLGISHTWIGDLDVEVSHGATTLRIWDQRCGSWDDIQATADDAGLESLCSVISAGPIDSVFFSPEVAGLGPLSVFNGMDSAGDWTITVFDRVGGDDGTLDQWSVHIDGVGVPPCELNVTVCHYPNSGDPHTIVVGESSVISHINHGDTVGPCAGDGGSGDGSFGN
jgi:subtilisin-like proprotein convertase family protein